MSINRMWRTHDLKSTYDVVIIGAGVHGLAIAYYLGQRGITSVAVFDKGYLGGGASGRNTAIVRSNYRTPEGAAFYNESLKLYERLAGQLDYNLMLSQQGHFSLAHAERGVVTLRERCEVNKLLGIDSRLIFRDEIRNMVPGLEMDGHQPILAALYHPPGGIIRHDAVVWGYARGVDRQGLEIHPFTEVTAIEKAQGKVTGVVTNRGRIKTGIVVNAAAGWCSAVANMAGVELPIVTHPLQALVTERLKPFLHHVIVSATLHVYINQTDRGEVVIGEEIDPYASYSQRSTLRFLENAAAHTLDLFPCLARVKVLRQWGGICDMTPDFAPILGKVNELEGFLLDVGWGTYGFKAGPVAGYRLAELIATGQTPDLIKPFALARFANQEMVGEKAAAAVSH